MRARLFLPRLALEAMPNLRSASRCPSDEQSFVDFRRVLLSDADGARLCAGRH